MDFFNQQRERQKKSRFYIALFILAVLIIDIVLCLFLGQILVKNFPNKIKIYLIVSVLFSFSLLVSFLKMRLGHASSANSLMNYLGGISLQDSKLDNKKIILKNCVEEMAIASGIPCPNIFLFENETGINAMASGYSIHDSAIAVTQGSLDHFNRDELQAVVAHEFGHILSGDSRINMLMLAALNSISSIYLLGKFLLWPKKKNFRFKAGIYQFALGFFLMALGSLGQVFSKMIKAALSRQREYLADALSVQFTRNPNALVNALKIIGGDRWGSQLFNPYMEKVGHMMFAKVEEAKHFESSIFSSHPSLKNRINVYDKSFDGHFTQQSRKKEVRPGVKSKLKAEKSLFPSGAMISPQAMLIAANFLNNLNHSKTLWIKSSEKLKEKICALYVSENLRIFDMQVSYLEKKLSNDEMLSFYKAYEYFKTHSYSERIGVQDLLIPILKKQNQSTIFEINKLIKAMINCDEKITLFECVAYQIFKLNCLPRVKVEKQTIKPYEAVRIIMSCFAFASEDKKTSDYTNSFLVGMNLMYRRGEHTLFDKNYFEANLLLNSLERVSKFSSYERQNLLKACYKVIAIDQKISEKELSILRLLGEYLEMPIPISAYKDTVAVKNK